jgi:hypothetical protein
MTRPNSVPGRLTDMRLYSGVHGAQLGIRYRRDRGHRTGRAKPARTEVGRRRGHQARRWMPSHRFGGHQEHAEWTREESGARAKTRGSGSRGIVIGWNLGNPTASSNTERMPGVTYFCTRRSCRTTPRIRCDRHAIDIRLGRRPERTPGRGCAPGARRSVKMLTHEQATDRPAERIGTHRMYAWCATPFLPP